MTLAEFFRFLCDNGLDYSVNVFSAGLTCDQYACVIVVSKLPIYIKSECFYDKLPSCAKSWTLEQGIDVKIEIARNCYIIKIDQCATAINSETLLQLAKKIWEDYINVCN